MKDKKLNIDDLVLKIVNTYKLGLKEYNLFLDLTQKQAKAIADDNFAELNQIIIEKEKVISQVNELEKEINTYKKKLVQELGIERDTESLLNLFQKDIPSKTELKEVINNIHNTLLDIQDLDKINQHNLINKKSTIEKDLFKVKKGLNINKSYNNYFNKEAKFIDKKG